MSKSKRKIKSQFSKYRRSSGDIPAVMGNYANQLYVPNRANYVFVKLQDGTIIDVYNVRVTPKLGLEIWIGYLEKEPHLLQVVSARNGQARFGDTGNPYATVQPHHLTHEWMAIGGGNDVVFSQLRQFMPLRPTPLGGMTLGIYRGVGRLNDNWVYFSGSSINLAPYAPSTGSLFALVYETTFGTPAAVVGTLRDFNTLSLSDIPTPPQGTLPVAAVRLYGGQTGIIETRTTTDLIDLRFPYIQSSSTSEGGEGSFVTGSSTLENPMTTYGDMMWENTGTIASSNLAVLELGASATGTSMAEIGMSGSWRNVLRGHIAYDDLSGLFWQPNVTNYSDMYGQWVIIDIGSTKTIKSFSLIQSSNYLNKFIQYKVYSASTPTGTWTLQMLVDDGSTEQIKTFPSAVTARYFRFEPTVYAGIIGLGQMPPNIYNIGLYEGTSGMTPDRLPIGPANTVLTSINGKPTWYPPQGGIRIYDDGIFKVTGTAIDFGSNLNVSVTGSIAFVNETSSASGGLEGYFNVKDYGAAGDGITNDTSAIQDASDAALAAGGGVCWFPPGTYLSDTINCSRYVSYQGCGRFVSIIKANSAGSLMYWATPGAGNPEGDFSGKICDLALEGDSVGTNGIDIVAGVRVHIEHLYIRYFTGIGIKLRGVLLSHIDDCRIEYNATGIDGAGGNNFIDFYLANMVHLSNLSIVHNTSWGVHWATGNMLSIDNSGIEWCGTNGNSGTGGLYIAPNIGEIALVVERSWFESNAGFADVFIDTPEAADQNSFLSQVIFAEIAPVPTYGLYVQGSTLQNNVYCEDCVFDFHGDAATADFYANAANSYIQLENCDGTTGGSGTIEVVSPHAAVTVSDTATINLTLSGQALSADLATVNLDDLTNVTAPSPTINDVLIWNGSAWVNYDPNRLFDRAWGSMYQDDIGTTITVGATNTDYIVTGMSAGVLGNMTFQNAKELVIVKDGVYQVVWSLSLTAAAANQEIEGAVGVGGVRQASTSAHKKVLTGADTVSISGTGLLSLAAGNLVQIVVRNETGTNNIGVQHANLSLVFLGLTVGGAILLESGDYLLLESGDNLLQE